MKIAILGTKGVPGRHGVEVVVDSLLPHLAAFPVGADDLQILVSDAFADITFNPNEHAAIMAL